MGRKRLLKISVDKFKEFYMKKSIDENGNKVSMAKIAEDEEFMEYTGLFKTIKGESIRLPVSDGTITYWMRMAEDFEPYKGVALSESLIFKYGKDHGLIPEDVEFKDWSLIKNLNGSDIDKPLLHKDKLDTEIIKYFGFDLPSDFYKKKFQIKAITNMFGEEAVEEAKKEIIKKLVGE